MRWPNLKGRELIDSPLAALRSRRETGVAGFLARTLSRKRNPETPHAFVPSSTPIYTATTYLYEDTAKPIP